MAAKACHMTGSPSVASPRPKIVPKVETRFSLAMRALMEAAVACQLAAPSGAKIHEMAPATMASSE